MVEIAKSHGEPASTDRAAGPGLGAGWAAAIARELAVRGAHPARSVVLLPSLQLVPLARAAWASARPAGFAPRFETTQTWAESLGGWALGGDDLRRDAAFDLWTAQALMERAGLRGQGMAQARWLVDAAYQLLPLAAGVAPAARPAWAQQARLAAARGMDAPALLLERALGLIAVAWVASSAQPGDRLWQLVERAAEGAVAAAALPEAVLAVPGLQPDPLAAALLQRLGARAGALAPVASGGPGRLSVHAADDAEDEAERAASCVLRHLEAGRAPVGLVAVDRALTRRVLAMLNARGVAIRDTTGWRLSTTRAAAGLLAALRACAWDAGADAVLDWLKQAPGVDGPTVDQAERLVRRSGCRTWREACAVLAGRDLPAAELARRAEAWRARMQEARPLGSWLDDWSALLQETGQWQALKADAAGRQLIEALHLQEERRHALGERAGGRRRRLAAHPFSAWVQAVLESANFVPEAAPGEQVLVLPLPLLVQVPLAAVVVAGCDERHLPMLPEPPAHWTTAQREALGLPARDALAQAQQAAWRAALAQPVVALLWRRHDDSGEPVLPSPLLQLLLLDAPAALAPDPRVVRRLAAEAHAEPAPAAPDLLPGRWSAAAYEDLRQCPYRFFALRQLGLERADELDVEIDKRDLGVWLHAALKLFHEALAQRADAGRQARQALLDEAALQAQRERGLSDEEFLPLAAAWPALREGYLDWLEPHERSGHRFVAAELERSLALAPVTLHGRLDRLDRDGTGLQVLIDYKTEPLARTRERVRLPEEDTQLAFYATLLDSGPLRAGYLSIGEREGCHFVEQPEIADASARLRAALLQDAARLADGAALPALGEGRACVHCAARGLCRRDFRP